MSSERSNTDINKDSYDYAHHFMSVRKRIKETLLQVQLNNNQLNSFRRS